MRARPRRRLASRQKPITRWRSAWCPGGLTSAKARVAAAPITRSTASIAAPAARRAISHAFRRRTCRGRRRRLVPRWPRSGRDAADYVLRANCSCVASRGAITSPLCAAPFAGDGVITSARSGDSGWPGGVWCSAKRSEEIRISVHDAYRSNAAARCSSAKSCSSTTFRAASIAPLVCVVRDIDRLPHRNGHGRKRFRNLRPVPAAHRPVPAGFEVKRKHRMAGGFRKPDRARLRDTRRTARSVNA